MANQVTRMTVISKPEDGTASVFMKSTLVDFSPYITGDGNFDYICGKCNHVLQQNVNAGQVKGIVMLCPVCGNYNI